MLIKYAIQTCDRFSNQNQKRYCGDDRLLLCKKSITSILKSIEYASKENSSVKHRIRFFEDRASQDLKDYLQRIVNRFNKGNISIDIVTLQGEGVMASIGACYDWLLDTKEKADLIYQLQDDYLFIETGITEMIDMFYQLYNDAKTEAIISCYNDPWLWLTYYRYKSTPRVFMPGLKRYWIQYYDMSCSFLTSPNNIINNKDLLDKFLSMSPNSGRLEADSLNYLLNRRGILGMVPVESVGLHVQSIHEKDPFIDWKSIWDAVEDI